MDDTQQPHKAYTLAELESYLQHESPDDFPALPPTTNFVFDSLPEHLSKGKISDEAMNNLNPLCRMQLLLGRSTGEYTDPNSPVYLCLGGDSNNGVGLNCNGYIHQFTLDMLSYVDLEQSFRKLLRSEHEAEVLYQPERRRFRAFLCYLFLKAGHINGAIEHYSGFKDDLRYAATWFAREGDGPVRTARQKAATSRQKEEIVKERTGASQRTGVKLSDTHHVRREMPLSSRLNRPTANNLPSRTRIPGHDKIDDMPPHAPKRRKFSESVGEFRRHYETVGQHLLAFETEIASMELDPQVMAELEKLNAEQADEIKKLKQQLHTQNTELLKANIDASVSEQNARMEKAARGEETARREEAEARLNKYLDAHKKMTAMFSSVH